ncbi:MAG TPA: carboxypeptidase-like regulatory domain-containing protein [Longimicrobium sp.]|uniref:carboxypeptidase-like regulatory domain-containing protein n=1 Tax=Longimicrobium sp. TaxID=2029185 RepID=UPI002EDAC8FF
MTRMASARRALGAVMLAVAGMMAGADEGAAQDARVLGRVTDGVGNPVANAAVTLVPEGGGAGQSAVSGPTGGFQFQAVAPGTYTLRAERGGFAVQEQRITVRAGRVVTPVLRLTGGGRVGRGTVAARAPAR